MCVQGLGCSIVDRLFAEAFLCSAKSAMQEIVNKAASWSILGKDLVSTGSLSSFLVLRYACTLTLS
jgi:hypothetical protein